jgi:hypothetical protein
MRQRGAAYVLVPLLVKFKKILELTCHTTYRTRQVKDVDFGFSFGTPNLQSRRSMRETPANRPLSQRPSRKGPTPDKKQLPTERLSRRTPAKSESQPSGRKTPRSSRNDRPERPSPYDIPQDSDQGQGRRLKRRRISITNLLDTA